MQSLINNVKIIHKLLMIIIFHKFLEIKIVHKFLANDKTFHKFFETKIFLLCTV